SAQFVISKGAKAVITGNCGPNAVKTLSAAGVTVFLGITGTIKEAVEKYKSGNLVSADKGLGRWEWAVAWVEAAGGSYLWGTVGTDFLYPFFK
ncbi:MAG: NifB/NifX family molybdenum-iron cluster-binding protein, partial [Deltaproteobacteria bacterium]|nr:NifB/NifX family molybdenum-iron cluster-binding protein [Deltaproteobacteria bacterium]